MLATLQRIYAPKRVVSAFLCAAYVSLLFWIAGMRVESDSLFLTIVYYPLYGLVVATIAPSVRKMVDRIM